MTAPIVAPYTSEQPDATVDVLADAFVTNPLHLAVFGGERLEPNRLFFRIALENLFRATGLVVLLDGEVCGYAHFGPSPGCLPPADQVQAAAGTLFRPLGPAIPRVVEWFETWSRLDPEERHLHLGPIGISPRLQRGGLGSALMERYVEHLDRDRLGGYLETDRPGNVKFYERFGFEVRHEQVLVGTAMWTMWRPSRSRGG